MNKILIPALAIISMTTMGGVSAEARTRGHVFTGHTSGGVGVTQSRRVTRSGGDVSAARSLQTSTGRGYEARRTVDREPGSVHAERSFQTNNGRGITMDRSASWGDGAYHGDVTHTTNSGKTVGRSTSMTGNGDGTADATITRTHADGSTHTVTGTVTRNP